MADERQMSVAEWQAYFAELKMRANDPAADLALEDFRALSHLELLDRVKELEQALGNVERVLR
jgi:ribosomal protein L29